MSEYTLIEKEPMTGAERRVDSGSTIGREGCDITVSDPDVSRRHAKVSIDDEQLSIEDLGSTNGTFVNGERIDQPRRLSDGDEVRIGATVWVVRAPGTATRVPETATSAQAGQVTTVRAVPETAPTTAAAPAAPAGSAAPARSRGDVPQPEFAPSAIRRIVPVDAPAAFTPETQAGRKGSAATRGGATLFTTAVIALTTAGVILYYITEPFK
jgi:pSer/pThr/pTyr-binding forkhead associated (FHA) protein